MTAYARHFVRDTRETSDSSSAAFESKEYVRLKDDAPEWLLEAVREAHFEALPNDWIWDACYGAVCAYDEGLLNDSDGLHEYADGAVDIYNHARYEWAADLGGTALFSNAEEADDEMGVEKSRVVDTLGRLQYHAHTAIGEVMLAACKAASYRESHPRKRKAAKS